MISAQLLGPVSSPYRSRAEAIIADFRQLLADATGLTLAVTDAPDAAVVGAALAALDIVEAADDLRAQLFANAAYWRAGLTDAGFRLLPGEHPIIPVMLGEAKLAQDMAAKLYDKGIYVTGFFFPVVPKGQARIRTQMSAAHRREDLDRAIDAFTAARTRAASRICSPGGALVSSLAGATSTRRSSLSQWAPWMCVLVR
mgnify:CR=1 FL=1